jgi:hypothetical protein
VPQSAPMNSTPRSSARRFKAASSCSPRPSEKQNTCRPASSAAAASYSTWRPGTERNATLMPGRRLTAAERERAGGRSACPVDLSRCASARSTAASTTSSSAARIAITRSLGARSEGSSKPWAAIRSTLSGVAIATDTVLAPSSEAASRETSISVTESW